MSSDQENRNQSVPYEFVKDIVSHSKDEITWVRTAYKFAVTIVGFIVVVGLYFSYSSIKDLKSDLIKEGDRVQKNLERDVVQLSKTLNQELQKDLIDLRLIMTDRVDREFESDKIKSLISSIATGRIEEIANNAIKEEIEGNISPFRDEYRKLFSSNSDMINKLIGQMNTKISEVFTTELELSYTLGESKRALNELKLFNEFSKNVIMAQSGDRNSYEKIEESSLNSNDPTIQRLSIQTISYIQRMYRSSRRMEYKAEGLKLYDTNGDWKIGYGPYSKKQLLESWKNHPEGQLPLETDYIIDTIRHNARVLSLRDREHFYYSVVKDSKGSLDAAHTAAIQLTNLKAPYDHNLNFEPIHEWYRQRNPSKSIERNQ